MTYCLQNQKGHLQVMTILPTKSVDCRPNCSPEMIEGDRDLDLWPTDSQNNRDLLLNKGNHPLKLEGYRSKCFTSFCADGVFKFKVTVTLTFHLLNPKTIGVLYFVRPTALWSLKAVAKWHLNYWADMVLKFKVMVILTFHLLTSISIGVFHLIRATTYEGCRPNGTWVIDRTRSGLQTDGPTNMCKAIYPGFF